MRDAARRATVFVLIAGPLLVGVPRTGADGTLPTAKLQKAAVSCQKAIAQVDAKVVATKLKAIDGCAAAALACVQTKHDAADCLGKAGTTCTKKLNGAAAALAKAQAKIAGTKSCASDLRLPDLLSADGLGLGDLAGSCQTDFALDICTGLDALAACLVRSHERAAGVRYGDLLPRTGELVTLPPPPLPAIDGLPSFLGCGTCSANPVFQKPVEQCAKALGKATQTLVTALEKQLGACAQKVLACVQTKGAAADCIAKATAGCDKANAALTTAFEKFAAAIAKKCAASLVDYADLADPTGLNLAALAVSCSGAAPPTDDATFAACLRDRTRCATAALVRQSIPRTTEFAESGYLGTLAPELTTACPASQSSLKITPPFAPRPFFFGSIVKFLKGLKTPNHAGVRVNGGAPPSSPNAGRGVLRVNGPARVSLGGITKLPFRYKVGGTTLNRAAGAPDSLARGARGVDAPALMVTVQRQDVTLDDHFEVLLDPPPGANEVDDELEITYGDDIPGCAFTLALATRFDGVVSDYTPVLQVVDVPQPTPTSTGPTPTPTATPGNIVQVLDATGDGAGNTLDAPIGLAADGNGNVFVAGTGTSNVFKIASDGVITEVIDATGDGIGHALNAPRDVAADGNGNVFVSAAGTTNNVFKVTPLGVITQILDSTGAGGGQGFLHGAGITADNVTGNVFVLGQESRNAFKITASSVISQIIDQSGDGGGNTLTLPNQIAVDAATGNVFLTAAASTVFKITPGGTITRIIDSSGDGAGHGLSGPFGVAADDTGNAYVTGAISNNVFKIAPGGTITQIMDSTGDGAGNTASGQTALAYDNETDTLYVTAVGSGNVFAITSGGTITEIMDASGDGLGHTLSGPVGVAVASNGAVYVSGQFSDNVFKIGGPEP